MKTVITHRLKKNILFTFLSLNVIILPTNSLSHELQENRASIVLRNDRQISIAFYLYISEVLNKVLMAKQDHFEHNAQLASMNENDFLKQYEITKKIIEAAVVFKTISGKQIDTNQWQWPGHKEVQKHIRELTMQSVVGSSHHVHENPIEVRVQMQSNEPVVSLLLELPEALKPITIVSSRPKQTRLDLYDKKILVNF